MKKIKNNNLDSAKRRFIFSIILLVMAVIYLISPIDLIPGPPPFEWIEDIPILIASVFFTGRSYVKMKREMT